MQVPEQATRNLLKALQRKQRRHKTQLNKVEKTAARLRRRQVKLQALEAAIADLERRVADPSGRSKPRGKVTLRPARVIFNPACGPDAADNTNRLERIINGLRAHGIEPHIGLKTSGRAAREMARESVKTGQELIVVAAGDGTIEDVASQLVGSSTALGIIPIGTMNNLARSLGVPLDIDDACALIAMGTTRHIDMGHVIVNESASVRYFLEGAGIGLSALAALAGQAAEKRRWRILPGALRKMFASRLGTVQVQVDDTVIMASSRIVTVSNAPLMGSNLMIAPNAKMDDGLLDVTVYDGMGDTALMKHFAKAGSKTPAELKTYRARRVRITADEPVPSNSDKDVMRRHRVVEFEIVPEAISVIVGNGIALTLPVEAAPGAIVATGEPPRTNGTVDPSPPEPLIDPQEPGEKSRDLSAYEREALETARE
jgi:diacylglycerol kinase (ATP)